MIKTPTFWQSKNLLSTALLPLSALYAYGAAKRPKKKAVQFPVPVICIGNVTAGGSGKTPVAIAIANRLKTKTPNGFFLSRGYGGSLKGPVLVNPDVHSAREVGDEPLLLARVLPTIVARNRRHGAAFACEKGASAIIMDDGFQNSAIKKDLSLLVVDGRYGFGNGRLLPAGPLRETPEATFARAQAIVVVGKGEPKLPGHKLPVFHATLTPVEAAHTLSGRSVFAFCGIANPQKFFDTLTLMGTHIVGSETFPDHYIYRERDMKKLAANAMKKQGVLVTTAKDAVRLHAEWKSLVTVIEVALQFNEPETLDALLDTVVKKA